MFNLKIWELSKVFYFMGIIIYVLYSWYAEYFFPLMSRILRTCAAFDLFINSFKPNQYII